MSANSSTLVIASASAAQSIKPGRMPAANSRWITWSCRSPAIDDGVLVAEPGVQEAVRFRHDRTREAILRNAPRTDGRDRHGPRAADAHRFYTALGYEPTGVRFIKPL